MVRADLESLVSPHDETGLAILLVLEQPDIASASLFPLPRLAVELEQLSPHLEGLLLEFLVRLGIDLFGQANDRLEVHVGLGFWALLLKWVSEGI